MSFSRQGIVRGTFFGLLLLGVTLVLVHGIRTAQQAARLARIRGNVAWLYFLAETRGSDEERFQRVTTEPDGKTLLSWRLRLYREWAKEERSKGFAVPNLPREAPIWLRSERDDGPPTDTSFVVVYETNTSAKGRLWGIAEVPRSGIPWTDTRDFRVDEFIAWADQRTDAGETVIMINRRGRIGSLARFKGLVDYGDDPIREFLIHR